MKLELKIFAETYATLESKSLEIMKVYNLNHCSLDGIEVEYYNGETLFNIKSSVYYSGCGTESEWLTFKLEEMNNNISYFKDKRQKQIKEKTAAKELSIKKEIKDRKILKEAQDKRDYERLKKKFN